MNPFNLHPFSHCVVIESFAINSQNTCVRSTELSKKMDGVWNRYNLKSTGRIYTFGILKYSEKFKVLDLL